MYISSYKRKQNKVNKALRKAKSAYFKKLLNENKKLPRVLWKTLKKIYPVKSGKGGRAKNFSIDREATNNPLKVLNCLVECKINSN